ncbi:MAG: hypothetical protein ACRYGK_01595 [Janthinobacterium lividum]
MNNDISALRQHLFDTLAALQNKEKPMEIERAKAVSEVAQVIINSAKVEVEYAKVTGVKCTSFLEKAPDLPTGITGTQVHRIR